MSLTVVGGRAFAWPGFLEIVANTVTYTTAATISNGNYFAIILQAREALAISHVGLKLGAITSSGVMEIAIETVNSDGSVTAGQYWDTNTKKSTSGATQNVWNLFALDATANIAVGQKFALTFRWVSGTSVVVQQINNVNSNIASFPYIISTGTKARMNAYPIALGSSSSAFYKIHSFMPSGTVTTNSITNSGTIIRGARFRLKFPARCMGLQIFNIAAQQNYYIGLYDDSGNELNSSKTSVLGGQNSGTATPANEGFDNPVTLAKDTWYNALIEGNAASATTLVDLTAPSTAYLSAFVNWGDWLSTSGTAYNSLTPSTDKIPLMNLLLDSVDDGAGAGGGGLLRHPGMNGGFVA